MHSIVRPFTRLLITTCFACAGSPSDVSPRTALGHAEPVIHQFAASELGLAVNSYIIEGEHGLVAIDSALTVSDARALRTQVDALGKPLLAVLLTHGHPDHYNGVFYLVEGRSVPVYATAAVARVVRDSDAAKEQQWRPMFKEEWPPERTFPDHELAAGDPLSFDGLTFVVRDLGPGESHADAYWELLEPERAAFVGDAVLNGEHAYTNDGHTSAWIANLDRLARELEGVSRIYPGHGPAGDASLFAWEKGYLVRYREQVDALRGGKDRLTDAERQTLITSMKAAYPDAGLDFMIGLGADSVAAELASQPAEGSNAR